MMTDNLHATALLHPTDVSAGLDHLLAASAFSCAGMDTPTAAVAASTLACMEAQARQELVQLCARRPALTALDWREAMIGWDLGLRLPHGR